MREGQKTELRGKISQDGERREGEGIRIPKSLAWLQEVERAGLTASQTLSLCNVTSLYLELEVLIHKLLLYFVGIISIGILWLGCFSFELFIRIYLFESQNWRRERKRPSLLWSAPQKTTKARTAPGWSQEAAAVSSGSPAWLTVALMLCHLPLLCPAIRGELD